MSAVVPHLRAVRRAPVRLLLCGVTIAVATFFITGTLLGRDMALRTITSELTSIPEAASAVVRSPSGFGPAELDRIAALPGVTEASGRVSGSGLVGAVEVDLTADPGSGPLSRVEVDAGTYPRSPGQVAASARAAERLGLGLGDEIRFAGTDGRTPRVLTVTALVDSPSADGLALYASDREVLALTGAELARVDVTGDLPTILDSARPTAMTVLAAADARRAELRESQQVVDQVSAVLGAFVVLASLASAMVAVSAFRIVFAQRIRHLAMLRALGATRGGLRRALIAEGAITGLIATSAGTLLAMGISGLVPLVAPVAAVTPSPLVLGSVVVGVVLAVVLAVLAPAQDASRVSPLEALRSTTQPSERRSRTVTRTALGVALLTVAVLMMAFAVSQGLLSRYRPAGNTEDLMVFGVVAVAASFGAYMAFAPRLVRPVLAGVHRVVRRGGAVVTLAVRSAGGMPRRAASVSSVVALAATLLLAALTAGGTLRDYSEASTAAQYPAGIEVRAPEGEVVPAGLPAALAADPALSTVIPFRSPRLQMGLPDGPLNLEVSDLPITRLPNSAGTTESDGSLRDLGPGTIAVADSFASKHHVAVGDSVLLGDRRVRVAAVVVGEGLAGSQVLVHASDLDALGLAPAPTAIVVDAARAGTDGLAAAQSAVAAHAATDPDLEISVLADLRAKRSDLVGQITGSALALIALTVLVAIVGVGTTASLSVVERRRESGTLRAVGLSRSGLRRVRVGESALYGLLGVIFGAPHGVMLGALLITAVVPEAALAIPAPALLAACAGLVAVAGAAGFLPSWRASRTPPAVVTRQD
ncbi:FtsX-like permease family protein [Saccharopolyspora sp. NPDC002376]